MSIEWLTVEVSPPESGREIIAKNPEKVTSVDSATRQCKVVKFHKNFTEKQIVETLLSDKFTLWSYTE